MKFLSDFHIRDILKGGAQALTLKIVSAVIGFMLSVTLGRFYGPEGIGIYALMLNTILISATLATAGLDNAVIRFVSSDIATDKKIEASKTLNTAIFIVFVLSSFTAIGIYLGRNIISTTILDNAIVAPLLVITSLCVVCIALLRICAAGLKALGNIPAAHLADGVMRPFGILTVFLLSSGEGLERVSTAYLFGTIIALTFGAAALYFTAKSRRLPSAAPSMLISKRLWHMGWPTLGIVVGVIATEAISTIILSHYSPIEEVGRFRVAWQIAFLVSFLTIATDSILSPKISALYVKKEMTSLAKVLRFNIQLITLFSIPAAFILIFFSSFILNIFGEGFQAAAPILAILVFGQIINGTFGTAGKVLIMTGHQKKSLLNSLVGIFIIFTISLLLVPHYGAIGAALSVAITMTIRCSIAMVLVRIYLGINMLTGISYNVAAGNHNG